jgi:hypothetical protein
MKLMIKCLYASCLHYYYYYYYYYCDSANVDLYIHSLICLHGVVLF